MVVRGEHTTRKKGTIAMRILTILPLVAIAACTSGAPQPVTIYEVPQPGYQQPAYQQPPATGTASSFGGESFGTTTTAIAPSSAVNVGPGPGQNAAPGSTISYDTPPGGAMTAPGAIAPEQGAAPGQATQIGDDRLNLAEFSMEQQKIDAAIAEQELQAARQQLVVVNPSGVPSEAAGPNIVLFAQQSANAVGERVYPRNRGIRLTSACSRYRSDDDAQRAFLAAGGPTSDGMGLDPDGDGFACDWNPAPFRDLR